jgi:hypothetical protein
MLDQTSLNIKEGRLVVGPLLASRILSDLNYDGQRKVRKNHIASLAATMRRKAFLPGSQLAFVHVDGRWVLVNGQHRLHAIIESGAEIEFQVLVHDAASEEEIPRIYFGFDRHTAVRTDRDLTDAAKVKERTGVSATAVRGVWQAAPIIAAGFARLSYTADATRRDDDYRLDQCEPWWPAAARYEALLDEAPSVVKKRLLSAQGMAVALVLLRYQPEEAVQFFQGLAADDGLKRDDPRKALLIDLTQRAWRRQSMDGCMAVSLAWNAFFMRRPLQQIKIVQNARFKLDGTPYGGRR